MRKQQLCVIVFALVLGALVGAQEALAVTKNSHVTFDEDLLVGGTLVKKGDYSVTFDNQSNRLMISHGKRVVAEAPATLEDRSAGEHYAYASHENPGGQPNTLTAIKVGKRLAVISPDNQEGNNPPPMSPAQ